MTTTATTTTAPASSGANLHNLDKNHLIEILVERDKRIENLERQLEDQKRLRIQDSNQVEEKAAKIKEWVTNKLKELENQNRQLREQNKRQKETVESLNIKLATLSPISSPRKRNTNNNLGNSLDKVQHTDKHKLILQSSPIDTIDVNQSLKTRRPQLKKVPTLTGQSSVSSSSSSSCSFEEDKQNLRITLTSNRPSHQQHINAGQAGVSLISIGESKPAVNRVEQRRQQDSPLYDSVNIEMTASIREQQNNHGVARSSNNQRHDAEVEVNHYDGFQQVETCPPPPPLHQFDRWERELYDLAEKAFTSLMHDSQVEMEPPPLSSAVNDRSSNTAGTDVASPLRKFSSNLRRDIISVIKPSFTTIDGDQVVDEDQIDQSSDPLHNGESGLESLENQRSSNGHSSRTSSINIINSRSVDYCDQSTLSNHVVAQPQSQELMRQKSADIQSSVFSSPIRSRSGKDSILRTQSVRRNPAPEKLYDFVAADLVKRGYLVKHGALRSHTRWFVLRNFTLYSYKRESEETDKASPTLTLKLDPSFHMQIVSQSNDGYPFKITYSNASRTLLLVAESARARDEWVEIMTVAINMSDIETERQTKLNSQHEGILTMTRHGHAKRCHAVLIRHVIFFLKSPIDPTPVNYLSVKSARIREVTDINDYDVDEQDLSKQRNEVGSRDCSLAIYPRFAINLDPVYLTFGSQQDADEWFYHLSSASGLDQSSGTQYERLLTHMMLDNSIFGRKNSSVSLIESISRSCCSWKDHSIMVYGDKPITQPLTSLPNETLRIEAIEMFKSILLFTQVPVEPVAVDYHICLLQNCLSRFLKHPELRNEFFAQLIKQSTYIVHRSSGDRSKLSSISSSEGSSVTHRSSEGSVSPVANECQFVTDLRTLEAQSSRDGNSNKCDTISTSYPHQTMTRGDLTSSPPGQETVQPAPTQSELLQVMQIFALAVSLNLPRGRLRWWLISHLRKFTNPTTNIGKYALYTLKAIERTSSNGCRDNVPARTEILSILLRNPYDHSTPHSIPVSFADTSYLLVGADGSTTIEEFMASMSKTVQIRPSPQSDFYLFADDPGDTNDVHILEPQRKVLDVVGWWEQTFKQCNIGRQQNTRVIRILCKKRLPLNTEDGETDHERLLIVYQVNQEISLNKIPLSNVLVVELATIMTQLTFGDFERSARDHNVMQRIREHIANCFLARISDLVDKVLEQWPKLSGKNRAQCVRVYLNCIRRLKLGEP